MKKNMKFPKRKVLKRWVRILLLAIIIILFTVSFKIIYESLKTETPEIVYSYKTNQSINYTVELFDNSFIDKSHLNKDETYISDLVKQINATFHYNYSGSKITPLEYSYKVIATINGKYNLNNETSQSSVWSKEYTLLNETTKTLNDSNNIIINQPIDIDFKYYNNEVSSFRKQLKLPITATLDVDFIINVKGSEKGKIIDDEKKATLQIPLNIQAFNIKEDLNREYSNSIVFADVKTEIDVKNLIVGIFLFFTSLFILIIMFRIIFNIPKKNAYTLKLNKILKEYSDVIVELITPLNTYELDVVEVKSFDELIDLEEELRVPIMFYEIEEYMKGEFSLVHNNILYRFVLKIEDLM